MSFDLTARVARAKQGRRGLTLIELIVVLVILVGLGGLLVPTISNALSRTHVATCAQTFPEVHQMIQRALIESSSFGSGFDTALVSGGATPVNAVTGGTLAATTLSAVEAQALINRGITAVFDHGPARSNVTFDIDPILETVDSSLELITLTPAQADAIFLPPVVTGTGAGASKYVFLGIGREWTQLGTFAPEPPTHFGDTPGFLPDEVYSRFGIILEVTSDETVFADAANPTAAELAEVAGAEFRRVSYCLDGDGFETGEGHIEVYWEELNGIN
ncbi:MAG: type II secretion system protein [Planctomycetota bacterium]